MDIHDNDLKFSRDPYIQICNTIAQLAQHGEMVGEEIPGADIKAEPDGTAITAAAACDGPGAGVITVGKAEEIVSQHQTAIEVQLLCVETIVMIGASDADDGIMPV